jgi:hypothetical protein
MSPGNQPLCFDVTYWSHIQEPKCTKNPSTFQLLKVRLLGPNSKGTNYPVMMGHIREQQRPETTLHLICWPVLIWSCIATRRWALQFQQSWASMN